MKKKKGPEIQSCSVGKERSRGRAKFEPGRKKKKAAERKRTKEKTYGETRGCAAGGKKGLSYAGKTLFEPAGGGNWKELVELPKREKKPFEKKKKNY